VRVRKRKARRDGQLLRARDYQQPRQIDLIILATLASSRFKAGSVPSSGPAAGLPLPDDDSAVPSELVPGAVGLEPAAPPVTAW
jgi:hypothetical protein